jgi:hypothetical protein
MDSNTIFIHIPKTGGTTINTAMQGTAWQTEPNFNYRHILASNKYSNAGDIFNPDNFEKYKAYKIFMMLRHPIDRVTSEYYFIKERFTFMELLKEKPSSFKSYIRNSQTQNGVVNFLKGRRFYDIQKATSSDLDDILDAIDEIPVYVGIFEDFAASLEYFKRHIGIEWKPEIEVKRMTFKRPDAEELPQDIKDLILEYNQLDLELYNYALEKFNQEKSLLPSSGISFNKDKYSHVVPYAMQICLFEFCMDNKKYLRQHLGYFKDLTFYYLKEKNLRDGKLYCKAFNQTYVKTMERSFPNSELAKIVRIALESTEEPLDATYNIAKAVDKFIQENSIAAQSYFAPMVFDRSDAIDVEIKEEEKPAKKGFFGRLFGS